MDELMLKVLEEPNRIITGEQYNDLYKYFTETMTDEAARSFLAANYMMTHDFYSQYVNNGYLEDDLRLTDLNGNQKVEVQSRVGALLNNLTPELEQNMQSQYAQENIQAAKTYYPQAQANTSDEQNSQGYSLVKADWQDLSQDLNYSVADGNEELRNREQERRQTEPQNNQSDMKWSDYPIVQGLASKLSSVHFDEDGVQKNNQEVEIEGNVVKASDGELVIAARYPDINIGQKFSGFSLPSDILDKPALETVVDNVNSTTSLIPPILVGATLFNLLDSPFSIRSSKNTNVVSQITNRTEIGWKLGDNNIYKLTVKGTEPSWSTVRARFWKNEARNLSSVERYGVENVERMKKGLAPRRYNPDKGGMESMELSHEPIPRRSGGTEVVPRWPQEHAEIDPFRYPGY